MNFTDDDLKRLKNGMSTLRMTMDVTEYSLGADELEALITRLESAEKALHSIKENVIPLDELHAWRKASGK